MYVEVARSARSDRTFGFWWSWWLLPSTGKQIKHVCSNFSVKNGICVQFRDSPSEPEWSVVLFSKKICTLFRIRIFDVLVRKDFVFVHWRVIRDYIWYREAVATFRRIGAVRKLRPPKRVRISWWLDLFSNSFGVRSCDESMGVPLLYWVF